MDNLDIMYLLRPKPKLAKSCLANLKQLQSLYRDSYFVFLFLNLYSLLAINHFPSKLLLLLLRFPQWYINCYCRSFPLCLQKYNNVQHRYLSSLNPICYQKSCINDTIREIHMYIKGISLIPLPLKYKIFNYLLKKYVCRFNSTQVSLRFTVHNFRILLHLMGYKQIF